MLPEKTLELIQRTACESQAPRIIPELNGDGRTAYLQQGNSVKAFPIAAAVRKHAVHRLEDLIEFALGTETKKPVVWHGPTGVVLVTDDDDRRDRVQFPLTFSERFLIMRKLEKEPRPMTQPQFVRLLRIHLGIEPLVIKQFRRIDWENGDQGTAEVNHGNMRVGKSIVAKVQGIDELPDELRVPVPVYQQVGERHEYLVRCYIEIDPANHTFEFGPMPDELEQLVDSAQASIRERLETGLSREGGEQEIPVYYGAP
jgi:hypothetical protein